MSRKKPDLNEHDERTCDECGQAADGTAAAKELMDAPERPWVLCVRCHKGLLGMRRVGALRRF